MPRQSASDSSTSIPSSVPLSTAPVSSFSLSKGLHETWLDHLTLLLHVASGIEHELMIQYLYAAYSLGGDRVPGDQQELVRIWRRNLLAIAKEEMGHLLTVQNILTVLGAPVIWSRGNHPWDNQYFPLARYELSPLTMESLSCYVYAEAPAHTKAVLGRYYGIDPREIERIIEEARKAVLGEKPHRVEQLYAKIVSIIKNPKLIPDSAFHPQTYTRQASWEEWGKGYTPYQVDPKSSAGDSASDGPYGPMYGPMRLAVSNIPPTASQAHVIVSQVASRTEVLAALKLIGEQGESPELNASNPQPSHFDRFVGIYQQFENIKWKPTRDVPTNPTTWKDRPGTTYIESEHSRNWAHLFNKRYRMLLTYLSHLYELPAASQDSRRQTRAGTLHRIFSEMYNLRSIANILVRLPLMDEQAIPNDRRRAGPSFELPYTLALPASDEDCWLLHRELLQDSGELAGKLLPDAPLDGRQYLLALRDLDQQSIAWIDAALSSRSSTRSSFS